MSKSIVAQKRPGNIERNKARRKMPADYHALAASRGFEWIGPETPTTLVKTGWRCVNGHEWQARYSAIRDGEGCPWCNRHTDDDYHALAASKGFTWLGPHVESVSLRTRWRCSCGHEWEVPYTNLRGCDACWNRRLGDQLRRPPEDYYRIAKGTGYQWLGPEVKRTSAPTFWLCPAGHTWRSSFDSFQKGRRCSECRRLQPEDYHAAAERRGFLWVGERQQNNKVPTKWQCPNGHVWEATFNNISRGSGCPQCLGYVNGVRVSKQQRELCNALGGTLNYRVGRKSIDVALFVDGAKIACEYDAHYWHAGREEEDRQRTNALISDGWKVLAVKGSHQIPDSGTLARAIAALLAGQDYYEIVFEDGNKGKARQ